MFDTILGRSNPLLNRIQLDFNKCFNNATNNKNYNYGLTKWFNSLPHDNSEYQNGYPIIIKLVEFAEVNSDVLFNNFDFRKFNSVTFVNLGFTSTKFLASLYCKSCVFENNGRIDFNDFSDSIADATLLQIKFNNLINLNRDNLKKLKELETLDISEFNLDDGNAFNVPELFKLNVNLSEIIIERSKVKITLHDQVFRGLRKVGRIVLIGLQLDYIPKGLFKDLEELCTVHLSLNNIKTMDSGTFQTNKKLWFVSLTDNPLFTEPHDKLEAFYLDGETTDFFAIELGNFTSHTFDLLEQLIKNPKVNGAAFQSFLIDKFNITDFTKIHAERDYVIDISFQSGEPTLDLDHIKSFGNILRSEYDLRDNRLNALIVMQFAGDAICHDCTMIKYLFPHFLKSYQNRPGFFFEESRLFIEFTIPDSCYQLEENFEKTFYDHCPGNCTCKFNPLLDKVKIDCNNRNLTKIPQIPYPVQFDKLHSMDLYLENNSINVLSLGNQDAKVLEKLSTLSFKNNKIETLIGEMDLLNNIWALNICNNPIVATSEHQLGLNLASGFKYFNDFNCYTDDPYPRVVDYIKEHKSNELDGFLNIFEYNCI